MNVSSPVSRSFVLGALFLALLLPRANATLLTADHESQLEAWLGQGSLTFTNIFSKGAGDNSASFHAAVDGQGATFTLMSLTGATLGFDGVVLGGYNPRSWSSSGYNMSPTDADRTAFIYNLTTATIQRQNLIGEGAVSSGIYQSFNSIGLGPTFGLGSTFSPEADIKVQSDLNAGTAYNYSYGGTSYERNIMGRYFTGRDSLNFTIRDLEVYTFAPSSNAVPEAASTHALIALSFVSLFALRRRCSRV